MRLPDFIIIGAAKSGTTTLYQYLCRHPQVYMSTPKEPEFFARDERYAMGMEWYASLFSNAEPHQVCGEASTKYTRFPLFRESAPRMAQVLPDVKLIYMMRHPVEQAYSYYAQRIKTAQNTRTQLEVRETFEETLQKEIFFLAMSNYMKQIERYLDFFPKESFMFVFMEDFIQNPSDTLCKICDFIGINSGIDLIHGEPIAANQAKTHVKWFLRSRMTAPLKKLPGIPALASLLPQELKDFAYKFLKNLPYKNSVKEKYIPQPMLPETRRMLLEKFREPNQRLANFLNRDLSHWNQ